MTEINSPRRQDRAERGVKKKSSESRFLRCYFGHHKCMTSWVNRLLGRVCEELNWKFVQVFDPRLLKAGVAEHVRAERPDILAYTDPEPELIRTLGNIVGFHIIRDPRDIVVSAYYSHLNSHPTKDWPELVEHRAKLKQLSKDDGLIAEMDFRRDEFRQMCEWDYDQENILELRMEDLIANPYDGIVETMIFIGAAAENVPLTRRVLAEVKSSIRRGTTKKVVGLPLSLLPDYPVVMVPVEHLLSYIYESRFSALASGRERGEEDQQSHYRKGVAKDWKNHFKSRHLEYFSANYNNVLMKTGYESSPEWWRGYVSDIAER